MANANAVAKTEQGPPKAPIVIERRGNAALMLPDTFDAAWRMAQVFASSELVPKHFRGRAGDILVAWQKGAELGLSPMVSLEGICVIHGKTALWGIVAKALIVGHKDCRGVTLTFSGEYGTDDYEASYTIKRANRDEVTRSFTVAQAKRAGLWGKDTYKTYGDDMLAWKAFHRAASDQFADALCGLHTAEDLIEPAEPGTARVAPTRARGGNSDLAALAGRDEIQDAEFEDVPRHDPVTGEVNRPLEYSDADRAAIAKQIDALGEMTLLDVLTAASDRNLQSIPDKQLRSEAVDILAAAGLTPGDLTDYIRRALAG